jgi:hypothetical protein
MKAIRESDIFNMQKLIKNVETIRPYAGTWLAEQSYQSYLFPTERLVFLEYKYNSLFCANLRGDICNFSKTTYSFEETYEAFNNPTIIHFKTQKPFYMPQQFPAILVDVRYAKWYEYLALSPFSDAETAAERLKVFQEYIQKYRNVPLNPNKYIERCLFFDFLDATEKLKEFSAAGMKVAVYGVGIKGFQFIRFARCMNVSVDIICDVYRCGKHLDGIKISPPEILQGLRDECIVVIAILDAETWMEVKNTLVAMGIPEKRILPLYEHFAVGGRKWRDVLGSVSCV